MSGAKSYADPIGQALLDYWEGLNHGVIRVNSDVAVYDNLSAHYLCREFEQMPIQEQACLNYCFGRVLDIGAGAGSHSLVLQERGLETTAIDISPGAVEVMKARGVKDARQINFFDLQGEKYHTLLLMMNGIGFCGTLEGLGDFLVHATELLLPNGQILLDSSDLQFLFDRNGNFDQFDHEGRYYGEVMYQLQYQLAISDWFPWLYVSYETLHQHAMVQGFSCELLVEGESNDYAARLKKVVGRRS